MSQRQVSPGKGRRFRDLPVRIKVMTVTVAACAVLAAGITTIAYRSASGALKDQADHALTTETQLMTELVRQNDQQNLSEVQQWAAHPAITRVLENQQNPSEADVAVMREATQALFKTVPGMTFATLMHASGDLLLIGSADGVQVYPPGQLNLKDTPSIGDVLKGAARSTDMARIEQSEGASSSVSGLSSFTAIPVKNAGGSVIGVVSIGMNVSVLKETISAAGNNSTSGGQSILLDNYGRVVSSSVSDEWTLRPVVALKPEHEARLKSAQTATTTTSVLEPIGDAGLGAIVGVTERTPFTWQHNGESYRAIATPVQGTDWTYVAAIPESVINGPVSDLLRTSVMAALVGVLFAGVIAYFVAQPIAAAARRLAQWAQRVAEGDLEIEIADTSKDELGRVADAFRNMVEAQREVTRAAEAIAGGDLTVDVQPRSENDSFGRAFQTMTGNLRTLVGQVQESATVLSGTAALLDAASNQAGQSVQHVSAAVQGITAGAGDTTNAAQRATVAVDELGRAIEGIAHGATEQATQVAAVSSTTSQMASGVDAVARTAHAVAGTSEQARTAAQHGVSAVQETVAGMQEITSVVSVAASKVEDLGKLGERIGAVVETIDDIAEQTNLLALNAAIEAARAGEHGRGFAVVADEVRKLAERSQRETKAIADLITQVQQGTRDAVAAMESGAARVQDGSAQADRAGTALNEILRAIETTVSEVSGIATAAQEMADGARNVVAGMEAISAVATENAAATDDMTTQAGRVSEAIGEIAAVSEENLANSEEVSAATEETSSQVDQIAARARDLAATAEQLERLVARFTIATAVEEQAEEAAPTPLHLAA